MVVFHVTTPESDSATPAVRPELGYEEFQKVLQVIDCRKLIFRLQEYRWSGRQMTGKQTYSLESFWCSFILMYFFNLHSISDTIRTLQSNPCLREICGFGAVLPHRTTFSRMYCRIAEHLDLVEIASADLVDQLYDLFPDLGLVVSVDSTTVPTNGNPNRKKGGEEGEVSDPEASWTAKNSARAKGSDGKEWAYGYKMHALVDADLGIPLTAITTTASRNDGTQMVPLIAKTIAFHNIKPEIVIADRGYDSRKIHETLIQFDMVPIIHMRKATAKDGMYDGLYDKNGAPYCVGNQPMEYILTDDDMGDLYRCAGCHLKEKSSGAMLYCDTEVWEPVNRNQRLRGPVMRGTKEWEDLYDKRQSVERVFKSLKQSRRLIQHYHRSLRKIALHVALSTLTFQATALVKAKAGQLDDMRWMTSRLP